jgi:hypothetical protein
MMSIFIFIYLFFIIIIILSFASHIINKACGILDIHVLTINSKEKSS